MNSITVWSIIIAVGVITFILGGSFILVQEHINPWKGE